MFYHYIGYDPLRHGLVLDHVLVLVGVGVLMMGIAAAAFERRDLRV